MSKKYLVGLAPVLAAAAFAVAPAMASAAPVWTINGSPVEETTEAAFTSARTTLAVPDIDATVTCATDSGTGTIGPNGEDHVNVLNYTDCSGEGLAAGCTVSPITLEDASTQLSESAGAIDDTITLNEAVPITLSGCVLEGTNDVTGAVTGSLTGNTLTFTEAPGLTLSTALGPFPATYTGDEVITSPAGEVGAEA